MGGYKAEIIRSHNQRIEKKRSAMHRCAQEAALELASLFRVTKVYLFGSVAGNRPLAAWSDVDLAVEGLAPNDLYKAISVVSSMCKFRFDIKPLEEMDEKSRKLVLETGELLYGSES